MAKNRDTNNDGCINTAVNYVRQDGGGLSRRGKEVLQVHAIQGGYMSYSDTTGDHIEAVATLMPWEATPRSYKVQVGTKQEIKQGTTPQYAWRDMGNGRRQRVQVLGGEAPKPYVEEVPIYETRYDKVETTFTKLGSPIQVGDKVSFRYASVVDGRSLEGTLTALEASYFVITTEAGTYVFPWSRTNSVNRVSRI